MNLLLAASQDTSRLFIELGLAVIGLAILARVASAFGFSAIPLYLLAGLSFGNGGIVPLQFSEEFVRVGSEVGVVLLLFMLGAEYTGNKLVETLRTGFRAGMWDLLANSAPGIIVGIFLKMPPLAVVLLGGITYISSSGIIAKVMGDLGASSSQESTFVVRVLVLEDLAMAVYLPVIAVLLTGKSFVQALVAVGVAVTTVVVLLFGAVRYGKRLSKFVGHQSDEVVLLSVLGLILFVSGVASGLQVSAAVGAFLVGVSISGSLVDRAERLISPLRDLFAATFFLFFGLQIDPASLPAVLPVAFGLAFATALTKIMSGAVAAKAEGMTTKQGVRAGVTLIPRGEFSIVISGLGVAIEPRLAPLGAAYVLILAVAGPLLARWWGVRGKVGEPAAA